MRKLDPLQRVSVLPPAPSRGQRKCGLRGHAVQQTSHGTGVWYVNCGDSVSCRPHVSVVDLYGKEGVWSEQINGDMSVLIAVMNNVHPRIAGWQRKPIPNTPFLPGHLPRTFGNDDAAERR